mmetsp:Transcript_4826/g.10610  ORF Transcript_4826/g.10610 Transcript_4826/m.10610 type:complete len:200 (-) Transcript_4826:558-1157(-)
MVLLGNDRIAQLLLAVPAKPHAQLQLSITRLAGSYRSLQETHYLPLSTLQVGVLRGATDVAAQQMQHAGSFDGSHSLAILLIGLIVSGFGGSMWLRHLEAYFGPSEGMPNVIRKCAADYTCWAPFANTAYLIGVPLLSAGSADVALASLHNNFPAVMLLEFAVFAPYNLVQFSLVPPALRPPVQALLSVVFTMGLSSLC